MTNQFESDKAYAYHPMVPIKCSIMHIYVLTSSIKEQSKVNAYWIWAGSKTTTTYVQGHLLYICLLCK